jgi:hypothetical protein
MALRPKLARILCTAITGAVLSGALALSAGRAAQLAILPDLVIEAPPDSAALTALAARLRALDPEIFRPAVVLAGLTDPGPPIVVALAPEGSVAARAVPSWVAGYADGERGFVVLLPARTPDYPDRSFETLLQHEVTHVLIARAAGGRRVPRWFDEGLAMAASRDPDLEDRYRVALAVLTRGSLPLAALDDAFTGDAATVARAYALARDLVREVRRSYGSAACAAILAGLADDRTFEQAFVAATGTTLVAVEAAYWERRTLWDRWVPIISSTTLLWGGITLLAMAAVRRRRARDLAVQERWVEADGLPVVAPDVGSPESSQKEEDT